MTPDPRLRRRRSVRIFWAGALLAALAVAGLALLPRAPGPAGAGPGNADAGTPAEASSSTVAPPAVVAPAEPAPAAADAAEVRAAHARAVAAPTLTRLVPSRGRFLVTRAIEQQATALSACFAPRADPPARPLRAVSRRSLVAPTSRGVLRLELEPQLGEIWILDATVEARGTGTDAELACARDALKGLALEVPASTPGERVAMLYPLP